MPTAYTKGQPHAPVTTVAGHFNGMHAAPEAKPTESWYRGDDYAAVQAERDRYRAGLLAVVALFDKEGVEMLDFLEVVERALKP